MKKKIKIPLVIFTISILSIFLELNGGFIGKIIDSISLVFLVFGLIYDFLSKRNKK